MKSFFQLSGARRRYEAQSYLPDSSARRDDDRGRPRLRGQHLKHNMFRDEGRPPRNTNTSSTPSTSVGTSVCFVALAVVAMTKADV